jgi:uncharacterized SAM-binding protein YcdF (DUF218 family)
MKKVAIIAFLASLMLGCTSVEVPTVEPWEGRYPTVEEFKAKTDGIQLKGGQ